METTATILMFIAVSIGVPSCVAFWIGLNLEKSSAQCESDKKDIRTNILMTKLIPTILTALCVAALVGLSL